jgi:hypothetical protein
MRFTCFFLLNIKKIEGEEKKMNFDIALLSRIYFIFEFNNVY